MKKMKSPLRPLHIIPTILENSDPLTKVQIALLGIVSLLCAACNVVFPYMQKLILEAIDLELNVELWIFMAIGVAGAVFLMLENFINITIMSRLRRELEYVMEESLSIRDQAMLQEKGVGVFAGAIAGDAEQLARVLAANWFSIFFNLIGAVVSIVISALWKLYFLVIVLIAYGVILVVIFLSVRASVHYFRKEKDVTYALNAKMREMIDTHRAIMTYGSYIDYREEFAEEVRLRGHYGRMAQKITSLSEALIKLVRVLALVAFFFFAVHEFRSLKTPEEQLDLFPVIVALVSYFETIFLPIGALNLSYSNAAKFRAFYEPYVDMTSHRRIGEVPTNVGFLIHNISHIRDGMVVLSSLNLNVDRIYGVFGLEGEAKARLISYLRGESYPMRGHIELGGARIFEIEKSLRLSLLTFNSAPHEIFGKGLEFNITLGKKLVSDAEYESLWKQYQKKLRAFFAAVDEGDLFVNRHHGKLRSEILADFFSIDYRVLHRKELRASIIEQFRSIADRKEFIATVGKTIYAKKYAKLSRYETIVSGLELEDLSMRPFGVAGQYLTQNERALVLLARFLLPETEAPFVLIDPLEHVPLDQVKRCVRFIKRSIEGRKGLIFTQDIEIFRSLTDEVLLFEDGRLIDAAPHAKLVKKSKDYAKLCKEKGLVKPVAK